MRVIDLVRGEAGQAGIRDNDGLEEKALVEAVAGWLVLAVRFYSLKDAPAAHAALASRGTMGEEPGDHGGGGASPLWRPAMAGSRRGSACA